MKTTYAIAVVPIVVGALGACGPPHPETADLGLVQSPAPDKRPSLQPDFGKVVRRDEPPPAISGGTLAMATDHTTAIAADPDRDRVYIVDLDARAVLHTVQLPRHSEPGRVAVDKNGHAYVALRRSGGLASIDLASGSFSIRDICVSPRGLAFDEQRNVLHVACASGYLVTVPTGGGDPTTRAIARDLRDVVMQNDGTMIVTTFRAAESIRVSQTYSPAMSSVGGLNLAWRSVAVPPAGADGGCTQLDCRDATAMVVQRPTLEPVKTSAGSYGANAGAEILRDGPDPTRCVSGGSIVTTHLKLGSGVVRLPEAVLPVDLATNGRDLAVVAAGNAFNSELPQIFVVSAADVRASRGLCAPTVHGRVPGQAVAAAFAANDALIIQTREPAALHIMSDDRRTPFKTISLATDSVADTGHAIFHANAGAFVACASCHAEGADDGHVWEFVGAGPRRTPSLLGTVAGTEPFHWDGKQKDLRDLVDHVFVERMSGPRVDKDQLGALGSWLFTQPAPAKLRAESAVTARGATLFQERCTTCHAGPMLTNNQTVDVGTGGAFQVPSLIGVGWRRSLIHTGCAQTLTERFDPRCGGTEHGETKDLSPTQVEDLVQFLETL